MLHPELHDFFILRMFDKVIVRTKREQKLEHNGHRSTSVTIFKNLASDFGKHKQKYGCSELLNPRHEIYDKNYKSCIKNSAQIRSVSINTKSKCGSGIPNR